MIGLGTPAASAQDPTLPRGYTSELPLPASNILAECEPPNYFHPHPAECFINPDSVAVTQLVDGPLDPKPQLPATRPTTRPTERDLKCNDVPTHLSTVSRDITIGGAEGIRTPDLL